MSRWHSSINMAQVGQINWPLTLTKVTCVVLQGMLFPNPGKPILFNTSKSIDRLAATAICPVEVEDRCICRVWK